MSGVGRVEKKQEMRKNSKNARKGELEGGQEKEWVKEEERGEGK